MTHKPLFNFILGGVFGGMIAMIVTLHIVTNQVQARNAAISDQLDQAQARVREAVDTGAIAQEVIDAWQKRAESCEEKFKVGTIIYEKQDLATIPLMHGSLAFVIRDTDKDGARPSLYIPAQVDIYTDRLDVRYEWVDGRTGQSKGIRFPIPPPTEAK